MTRPCWCGNVDLDRFSDDYRACARCGTLVSTFAHDRDVSRVSVDTADLYGKDYWFGHMERDLGFPNIYARARADLTERCVHWLQAMLKYARPPGRVLELGSAHGGMVALLRWAGFDATGLELSPAIAQIARDLFHVPMLQGPIEDQAIEAGSLDVIALMDVLEHLPDPVATMRRCVSLLKPGGFLLIQTPRYPDGKSLEAMRSDGDLFVEQLRENEHLYLFSTRSVEQLFAELGCGHVVFEPALFAHYDMFFVVSRQPLVPIEVTSQEEGLTHCQTGRLVLALLDLYGQVQRSVPRSALDASEADRAARLEVIERQGVALGQAEHELAMLRAQVTALLPALDTSEADRAARLEVIERQGAELGAAGQAIATLQARVEALQPALDASDADRVAGLEVIEQQRAALADASSRMASLRADVEARQAALDASEGDRTALVHKIEQQGLALADAAGLVASLEARLAALQAALATAEERNARGLFQRVSDRWRHR